MSSSGSSSTTIPISLELDSPELARSYDQRSDRQFNHGKQLIAALDVASGQRVLDVGAGTGRLAAHVAGLVGATGLVVAVDPLPLRIDIAREKARPNLETAVARAEDLSAFPAGSFDVVYFNSVLHWIEDKAQALREAFRVLKPGGKIGFSTGAKEREHQQQEALRRVLARLGLAGQNTTPHKISLDEARALYRQTGFRDLSTSIRTFVDFVSDADDLFAHSAASSFGNFLSQLGPEARLEVKQALARELEPRRTPQGIRLERYLIFGIAGKELH